MLVLAPRCGAQLTGSGKISGKVFNSQSGAPLPKATVTLELDGPQKATAVEITGVDGVFMFSGLPPGQFRLGAAKTGFHSIGYRQTNLVPPVAAIVLAEGAELADLILRLAADSTLSGTITDSDGDPAVATDVTLLRISTRQGKTVWDEVAQTTTDDRGAYRFTLRDPGRYCVLANSNGIRNVYTTTGSRSLSILKLPTIHPPACTTDGGQTIVARTNERITGVDFLTRTGPASSAKGKVILPEPFDRDTQVSVLFSRLTTRTPRAIAGFMMQPGGDVASWVQVPGEYLISTTFESAGVKYYGARKLELEPGEQKEYTLTPKPLLTLSCHVRVEGAGSERFTHVPIVLESSQPPAVGAARTEWKAGAPCILKDIAAGPWKVGFNPLPDELYVKSATLAKQDMWNREIDLEETPAEPLTIVLSTAGAEVSGKIEGAPLSLVIASGRIQRLVSSGADGSFRFRGLPPGDYRLYALEELDLDRWQEPAYLQEFTTMATELRLAEGDKRIVLPRRIPAKGQ